MTYLEAVNKLLQLAMSDGVVVKSDAHLRLVVSVLGRLNSNG